MAKAGSKNRKRKIRKQAVARRSLPAEAKAVEKIPLPFGPREIAASLLLFLIIFAVFSPALRAGFIWDDVIITATEEIYQTNGIIKLWLQPRVVSGELHYWPLTYTTFWLEDLLWGFKPPSAHAVNLVIHSGVCILFWQLLRTLDVPGSWLAALIFAVHPVHVEPVVWIIGRKDLLAALFYLGSALLWLRYLSSRNSVFLAISVLVFAAAMVSKSTAITLPLALILLIWWKQGKLVFRDAILTLPHFFVALAIGLADSMYYASNEPLSFGFSLIERIINASKALVFYVSKLAYPSDLFIIYDRWELNVADLVSWMHVAMVIAVAASLWWLRDRIGRGPLAVMIFFAITLLPALGFMDFGYMNFAPVADRYQYLASSGPIALLSAGIVTGILKLPHLLRAVATLPIAGTIGLLVFLTWNQTELYKDEFTFFTHVTNANPEARSASHNLGKELYAMERYEETIIAALRETRLSPNNFEPHALIALSLEKLGRLDEAFNRLETALDLEPDSDFVLSRLAVLSGDLGRYEEQLAYLTTLRELKGHNLESYLNFAETYVNLGRMPDARTGIAAARLLQPAGSDLLRLQVLSGRIELAEQRYGEAASNFEAALAMNSDSIEARSGLARARLGLGLLEQARQDFSALVATDGSNADHHEGLAATLLALGRHSDAISRAERALVIEPDHDEASRVRATAIKLLEAAEATP